MRRKAVREKELSSGKGYLLIDRLIDESVAKDHCRLFAKVVLKPFCEVGYHVHEGESETYYILSGKGIYNDNGEKFEVSEGDILVCPPGHGHALENSDLVNLEFMALILPD